MKFTDPNNPNEKKKMIAAGILGLAAILVLGYVFFGGSPTKARAPAKPRSYKPSFNPTFQPTRGSSSPAISTLIAARKAQW